MIKQLRVTLDKDELAAILAKHFDVEAKVVDKPTLEVYAKTDRYDQEISHYFVFTAETN